MYLCKAFLYLYSVIIKKDINMETTFNIGKEFFKINNSSIQDVKLAYYYKSDQTSEWIYNVDLETMEEIRILWKNAKNGNLSIYDIFCGILKINTK